MDCDYSFTTNITTSLSDENIEIYPNPFSDIIFVSASDGGSIEITDVSGKVVYYSTLSTGINEISTSHFSKGLYVVKIQNEDKSIQTFKIVKL